MSQDFKLKFDAMLQNDPSQQQADKAGEKNDSYIHYANARHICFAWPDGKRHFFNYSYLIGAEYVPGDRALTLNFTTHTIILTGYNLDQSFDDFLNHLPKTLVCTDSRYNSTFNQLTDLVINEIIVKANNA